MADKLNSQSANMPVEKWSDGSRKVLDKSFVTYVKKHYQYKEK